MHTLYTHFADGVLLYNVEPEDIFSDGQICGFIRCVEYRDSWSLAFSELRAIKEGQNLD